MAQWRLQSSIAEDQEKQKDIELLKQSMISFKVTNNYQSILWKISASQRPSFLFWNKARKLHCTCLMRIVASMLHYWKYGRARTCSNKESQSKRRREGLFRFPTISVKKEKRFRTTIISTRREESCAVFTEDVALRACSVLTFMTENKEKRKEAIMWAKYDPTVNSCFQNVR